MADKSSMLYNLRLKCAPMQNPESDRRYWYADAYGFSDNFSAPITDPTNGPYGPPQMRTTGGLTGRYAGSLVGTLARLQGYDSQNDTWRRVAVNSQGKVGVLPTPESITITVATVTVTGASTLLLAASPLYRYLRVSTPAGSPDLWITTANPATVGGGILVTPAAPFVLENISFFNIWRAISAGADIPVNVVTGSSLS